MKKIFSNEKGITVITVTMMIIVMTVILSVVTYYARNSIQMEQFGNMKADIEEIEKKAQMYYIENNALPIDSTVTKTRVQMTGDSDLFNPNDSDTYYLVNTDLINVKTAYDTNYYINSESHTVYAEKTIKISGKNYSRPKEDFDSLTATASIPAWEEECYTASAADFTFDSDGKITGINKSDLNLKNLVIPVYTTDGKPVTGIVEGALSNLALSGTLKIPSTIQSLESGCLPQTSNVTTLYCDAKTINYQVFANYTSLQEVYFGPNCQLTDAEDAAHGIMCGHQNLKKVWIEGTSIGKYTFANCMSLELIVLNNNIEVIPDGAFYGCVNGTMTILRMADSFNGVFPTTYTSGKLEWTENLKKIGNMAFASSSSIRGTIDFATNAPNLEEIGDNAFYGCNNITSVKLSASTTYTDTSFASGTTVNGGIMK